MTQDTTPNYAIGDELIFLPTGRKVGFLTLDETGRVFAVYEGGDGTTHFVSSPPEAFKPTGWKVPVREGV